MIMMQHDPAAFARKIGSHVRSGGVLVVTCTDSASYMGETLRRAIALRLAPTTLSVGERVDRLRALFASHLATLSGVSRPVEDWIEDNSTHPLSGSFFSIGDAIAALGGDFDVYGGSPQFLTDWRWYKQLWGDHRRFNERGLDAYRRNVLNLLDYREIVEPQPPEFGAGLLERCDALWTSVRAMEDGRRPFDARALAESVDAAGGWVSAAAPRAAAAFRETAAFLREPDESRAIAGFHELTSFFGRGAQYLSFVRR
jgi:hypothetical protein